MTKKRAGNEKIPPFSCRMLKVLRFAVYIVIRFSVKMAEIVSRYRPVSLP